MRYTKRDVYDVFDQFVAAMGGSVGWDRGQWSICHNSIYGGWVIELRGNSGGVSRPFGDRRRPTGEMVATLTFALIALEKSAQLRK